MIKNIAIGSLIILNVITLVLCQKNWYRLKPESVVSYQYLYTCEECGNPHAEGDYSFSVTNGYEYCYQCQAYRQFEFFEDSSLIKK